MGVKQLLCIGLISSLSLSVLATETMRVVGHRVNLRARPEANAEVVGQVSRGDILTPKSQTEAWTEVIMPSELNMWVHKDFLEDDQVVAPRLNARSGPGVNYSVVTILERGTRVTPRTEFSEWLAIEPVGGASVWIASEFVEKVVVEPTPVVSVPETVATPPAEPAPPPLPEPVPPPPPPRAVVERELKPPPEDISLIPLDGQGQLVERVGVLRPAGFFFGRPSRYRLTEMRGNRVETTAYVRGDHGQLHSLLGHQLTITGREYWEQGNRLPIIVPEKIILMPDTP